MGNNSKGTWVEKQMICSTPFLKLTKKATDILLLFRLRMKKSKQGKKKWVHINNGEIVFPYSEAEKKYRIPRATFRRAIDQLIELGFIDINHLGGRLLKDCTTYYLSERWEYFGTDEFVYKERPKDPRKLGFTSENWEERTGKKRKAKQK